MSLYKNFLSNFSKNHEKSQKMTPFENPEKWDNNHRKIPPMVVLGHNKYDSSISEEMV